MWFSPLLACLTSSRPLPARRPGWSRPLVIEPLEDRLVLTGKVDMDVAPGVKTRPQPPVILTFVMNVPVNWFDLGWLGGAGRRPKPKDGQSTGGTGQQQNNAPRSQGPSIEGLTAISGLDSSVLPAGVDGLSGLALAEGNSATATAPAPVNPPSAPSNAVISLPSTYTPPSPAADFGGASSAGLVTPAQSDAFFQQSPSAFAY